MSVPSAPAVTRFDLRSRDPELAHRALREAYSDFSVTLSGSTSGFRFAHAGVRAPRMSIGRIHYSMTADMDVQAPHGRLVVAARARGTMALRSGRETARPDVAQPMLVPPHSGWEIELADVDMNTVTLDWSAMDQAVHSVIGSDARRPAFTSMSPVSEGSALYWNSVVAHLERDVLAHADVAAQPLVLAEATRSLAAAMLVTFPNTALARYEEADADRPEPAVLRRALQFVDEHAGEDIGVEEIATAARIGVRGLQHLFRRRRDCTPLEHLRQVRMARAHAELQAADPSVGDTVATVAARWGFAHPGRFSVQYRQAYGCSPSETLRR